MGEEWGRCRACDRPTSTKLQVEGDPAWCTAGLVRVGISWDVAVGLTLRACERQGVDANDPMERVIFAAQLCQECADGARVLVSAHEPGVGAPTWVQPRHQQAAEWN